MERWWKGLEWLTFRLKYKGHPLICSGIVHSRMPHPLEHSPPDRPLGAQEASEMAEAMSVFAAESRVRLLYALLDEPRSVDELAALVGMEPSAVSQQLRILRQLRFVVAEREG